MSILQQSPVIETKKVSVISSSPKTESEPVPPAHYWELRRRTPLTDEQQREIDSYRDEHRAWEDRMEARGRGYSSSTVAALVDGGEQVLLDYLRLTGAPAEIIDIAKWLPTAAVVKHNFFWSWKSMSRFHAVRVGQFVPAMRAAIKSIRFFLDAARAQ